MLSRVLLKLPSRQLRPIAEFLRGHVREGFKPLNKVRHGLVADHLTDLVDFSTTADYTALEKEHEKLKKLYAEQALEREILRDLLKNKPTLAD